jgi:tetratricopeptide (TPR) repeat protein
MAESGSEGDAIRGVLAHSFYYTGASLRATGKTSEALAAFKQAQTIEEELTESHPGVIDYRKILSWCYNDIGNVLADSGKPAEALAAYEKSGQIKQKIAENHLDVAEYQRDLAMSHANIGVFFAIGAHWPSQFNRWPGRKMVADAKEKPAERQTNRHTAGCRVLHFEATRRRYPRQQKTTGRMRQLSRARRHKAQIRSNLFAAMGPTTLRTMPR